MMVDFQVLWRYFAWSNQTMAMITLWAVSAYLSRKGRWYWVSLVPALFMTVVTVSYILLAPEGLRLNPTVSIICGCAVAATLAALFFILRKKKQPVTDGTPE